MREQRTIFGEVAELYDKARAAYPEALFDDVLDYARCTAASSMRALEIGAGTGKATVALAARGVDVVALEPDAAMAAVLRRNCEGFPHVRIEVTTFEHWTASWKGFDLLYAAQAWHWVAREVRARRAAELLRSDGRSLCSGTAPTGAASRFATTWRRSTAGSLLTCTQRIPASPASGHLRPARRR